MHRFDLDETYRAEADEALETRIGEIFHVLRHRVGSGSVSTPVARFFVWRPIIIGTNPHWRIDCFIRNHALADDPEKLAKLLTDKLQELGLVDLPTWTSWNLSSEVGGERRGDLWEDD
jgi:hypothetical protein